ncbi:hypothetical protein GF343_02585 [Candidatus Woesearchaeota archaeon]|nr:hypothetical protein [Candidatus Woesearchaeota archaeon]
MNVADLLNQSTPLSEEQLEEILTSPRETVVDAVSGSLAYPNLNALIAAYHVPHESYEAPLLEYSEKDMQEEHAIYWMLSLGKIGSAKAFDRIAEYTETALFHQAFVSMAEIDLAKTMGLFEDFLDKNCSKYEKSNVTFKHDSGFNTLALLVELHPEARGLAKAYDLSNENKKKLVQDALDYKE